MGLASPAYQSPTDEAAVLVCNYPGRLLAELAVAAVFCGGNRLEIYGPAGAMVTAGIFGSRPRGTFTCKGQEVAYAPANPFIAEVADFVEAIQQQRAPAPRSRTVYATCLAWNGPAWSTPGVALA